MCPVSEAPGAVSLLQYQPTNEWEFSDSILCEKVAGVSLDTQFGVKSPSKSV